MITNNNNSNELKDIAPCLSQIGNGFQYSIPIDYFENFATLVMNKINNQNEALLNFPKADFPFQNPPAYFETLPQTILERLKSTNNQNEVAEELATIAPLLNSISKQQLYTVPKGYFETNESLQKAIKPTAKIAVFGFKKTYQFATAAAITGLLALGIFLFLNKENIPNNSISKISTTEVKNLTEDDIATFLSVNGTDATPEGISVSSTTNNVEIQQAVKEMSDDEIKQFLEETEIHEEI